MAPPSVIAPPAFNPVPAAQSADVNNIISGWVQSNLGMGGQLSTEAIKNLSPSQLTSLINALNNEIQNNPASAAAIQPIINQINKAILDFNASNLLAVSSLDKAANQMQFAFSISSVFSQHSNIAEFSTFKADFENISSIMSNISSLMLNGFNATGEEFLKNMGQLVIELKALEKAAPQLFMEHNLGKLLSDLEGNQTRGIIKFMADTAGKTDEEIIKLSYGFKAELSGYLSEYYQTFGGVNERDSSIVLLNGHQDNVDLQSKIDSGMWLPPDFPSPSEFSVEGINSTISQLKSLREMLSANSTVNESAIQFINERIEILVGYRGQISTGNTNGLNLNQLRLQMSYDIVYHNLTYLGQRLSVVESQIEKLENSNPTDPKEIEAKDKKLKELQDFREDIKIQIQAATQIIENLSKAIQDYSKGTAEVIELAGRAAS